MKHLLLLLLWAVGGAGLAQVSTCNPNATPITTNPSAPYNGERSHLTNTFDWTAINWPVNPKEPESPFLQPSPFYETWPAVSVFSYPNDGLRDMYATDGWELIIRDFGYGINGSPPVKTDAICIIFYNKYRSTLRVFAALQKGQQYNGANISLHFDEYSASLPSILDLSSDLHALDDFPFDIANSNNRPSITQPAQYLQSGWKWFYADFPIMYDPCTCFRRSLMRVKVNMSTTSALTLTGAISGTVVSSDGKAIASDTQYGVGKLSETRFGKVVSAFNKTEIFKSKGQETAFNINVNGNNNNVNLAIQGLSELTPRLRNNDFLKAGLSAIPYLDFAVSLFDAIIGGGKSSPTPQQVEIMPLAVNLNVNVNGTINTNGNFIKPLFRTPGSVMTNPNGTNADDYQYPLYNQTMGVVNLLRKPRVKVLFYDEEVNNGGLYPCFGEGIPCYVRYAYFKLAEPLQFVVNPAAGLEIVEVQGSYVMGLSDNYDNQWYGLYSENGLTQTYRTNFFEATSLTHAVSINKFVSYPEGEPVIGPYRLRFMLHLRRKNAPPNTQDILMTLTYVVGSESTFASTFNDVNTFINSGYGAEYLVTDNNAIVNFCQSGTYKTAGRGIDREARYAAAVAEQIIAENTARRDQERPAQAASLTGNSLHVSPNPAHGNTSVSYQISQAGHVRITLGDLSGRGLAVLVNADHEAGSYQTSLSTERLAAGVYICTMETEGGRNSVKVVVAK